MRCSAQLGEGICWHPTRQRLAWVDIIGGCLFEMSGDHVEQWDCGQMIGMIAPAADGTYLAALRSGIFRFRPETKVFRLITPAPYDTTAFRFNDGKVDARGRLWVGTLSLRGQTDASALYSWVFAGPLQTMLTGVGISNGLAWTADGGTLYYIDTLARTVQRFAFDLETGRLTAGEIAVTFDEEEGLPDGCAIDLDGNLWVAHWGGGRVTLSDPRTGRRLRTVILPVRNVTSCAFGGPRCDRLFISTARCDGLSEELAGSVFVFKPEISGSPAYLAPADFGQDRMPRAHSGPQECI